MERADHLREMRRDVRSEESHAVRRFLTDARGSQCTLQGQTTNLCAFDLTARQTRRKNPSPLVRPLHGHKEGIKN
jgi:hypothetical protein